jgi:hypothetical protein
MAEATVFQDKDGNWVGTRQVAYPSGAKGYERVTLIKHSLDCFADAELRGEAEARAARWMRGEGWF